MCFIAIFRNVLAAETEATDFETFFDDMPEARVVQTFDSFPAFIRSVALVAPDGSALISATSTRRDGKSVMEFFQWSMADQKIVQSVAGLRSGVVEAGLSANGRVLAAGSFDGSVLAWDLKSNNSIEVRPHEQFLGQIAISHDGKNVATAGLQDATIKETSFSVKQNHPSRIVLKQEPRTQCSSLAYSPDGRLLAAGIASRGVIVWDTKTLKQKWEQKARSKAEQIIFTPDSRTLISVEFNTKITLRDAQTGERQAVMTPKGFPIHRACVSPGGKWLATAGTEQSSEKQTVVVWNLKSRKGILRYTLTDEQQFPPQPRSPDTSRVAFLPDESGLVIFGKKPFVIGLAP